MELKLRKMQIGPKICQYFHVQAVQSLFMQSKYFLASNLSSSLHGHLGSLFGRRHLLGDGVECIIIMGFFSEGIDYLHETWQLCLMKACGLFCRRPDGFS